MNELDDKGELALELALKSKQDSMAENLVRHKADINHIDGENRTLLHLAIKRGRIDLQFTSIEFDFIFR